MTKYFTLKLPDDLHKAIKQQALDSGRTMKEVIIDSVILGLKTKVK